MSYTHNQAKAEAALTQAENALQGIHYEANPPDEDDALNALAPALIAIAYQLGAMNETLAKLANLNRPITRQWAERNPGGHPERD